MENSKIVIVTNGNYFAKLILDRLLCQYGSAVVGILLVTGDYKARTGLRALWEIGKSTALPYLIYKVFTIFSFKLAQETYRRADFSVKSTAAKYQIPTKCVVSVNSEPALEWVSEQAPDLLVSVSCPQMIKRKMLSLARLGGINIHSSLLSRYAGLAPYFWVLSTGEKVTGTTVHYMTLKFDEGNILSQKELAIQSQESAFNLFKRLAVLGSEALLEAVEKALLQDPGMKQDMAQYTYCSNPTLSAYIQLRRRGHRLLRLSELFTTIRQGVNTTTIMDPDA
jgi:methionyl-tRNA formyltransferase